MAADKQIIVAIELGSTKIVGLAGQMMLDGSMSILAVAREEASQCMRKGVVYNIDKTALCLSSIIKKLEAQLKMRIVHVFVGLAGQSMRSILNNIKVDLPDNTIITQETITELMDSNWTTEYPERKILEVIEQEYLVDTTQQNDPVGIRASHLEGNFLNIVSRRSFYQNLTKTLETAGIKNFVTFLTPLTLANVVLTESERRSGCVLVDLGADTTTVSVYYKNKLRHLAVIPVGQSNITHDIASLQMEESEAEAMKLQYASAYTESRDIDTELKYPINRERSVDSFRFIEIVEGRVTEIIKNVEAQIPSTYYNKLLGGLIITGGGANLKNIEKAFTEIMHVEKIRVAKFVNVTVNSSNEMIRTQNAMMNACLGILSRGYINCVGNNITTNPDLFSDSGAQTASGKQTTGSQQTSTKQSTDPGKVRTDEEEQRAAEEARRRQEEEDARKAAEEAEQRKQEEEEEEKNKKDDENSFVNRMKTWFTNFVNAEEEK